MKRDNWLVGDYSIRPAGKQDECFYCHAKVGEPHKKGCVIRCKTVVVKVSFDLVVDVPEDWDSQNIEYRYNESSYCQDNLIKELNDLRDRVNAVDRCLCDMIKVDYQRDASEKDETDQCLYVNKLPN